MDKVNKFQNAVQKKLSSKKINKNNSSGGDTFEQTVKNATAKDLRAPDIALNQKVIDLVPSTMQLEGEKEVARILTDRLSQKNPHKVYLAICLIREVLKKCQSDVAPAREDIMAEVGKVASQPMNRFDSNLSDQQRTKHAAFELLKTYGQDGHILSQPESTTSPRVGKAQGPPHSPRPAGGAHSSNQHLAQLLDAVQTQTVVASSHNDLLQDMLLDKTPYEAKTPQDRALAKDIIMDATKFGQSFEKLLEKLAAFDTPEAGNAMNAALEKIDILNNSLNLHKEMLTKELEGATGRTPKPASPTVPHNRASSKFSSPKPPVYKPQQEDFGNLLDMQQGLQNPQQPSQAAQNDPFAASTNWYSPAQQQQGGPQVYNHQPYSQPPYSSAGGDWPAAASAPGTGYGQGVYNQGFPAQQTPMGYNPYHQGYQQPWGGPQSSHPSGQQPWGGPPPSQGYGQQTWGGPQASHGYGVPPQGYGGYGPTPYGYQGSVEGFGRQPQDTQGSSNQPKPVHVPPPMMEAVITVPAKAMPSQTLHTLENVAASTPLSDNSVDGSAADQKLDRQTGEHPRSISPPEQPKTPSTNLPPFKPSSTAITPLQSPQPSFQIGIPSSRSQSTDGFGFESNAFSQISTPPEANGNSQTGQTAVLPTTLHGKAGNENMGQELSTKPSFDAFAAPQPQKAAPAAGQQQKTEDEWDLFFTDGDNKSKGSAQSDIKSLKPVDQLALAFKEMAAKRN